MIFQGFKCETEEFPSFHFFPQSTRVTGRKRREGSGNVGQVEEFVDEVDPDRRTDVVDVVVFGEIEGTWWIDRVLWVYSTVL